MSRTAITIAWPHKGDPKIIVHDDVSLSGHRDKFNELPPGKTHPEFSKVEIWHSDSAVDRRTFLTPEEEKKRQEDEKKSIEREEKAIADAKELEEKPKREAAEKAAKEQAEFVKRETEKQNQLAAKQKAAEPAPKPEHKIEPHHHATKKG